MAYTSNPNMPRVRMQAVLLVRQHGWSIRKTARHLGFHHTAIVKWLKKSSMITDGRFVIPTLSSRPSHHPNELSEEMVQAIIRFRLKHNRCAEVVHQEMINAGYSVSLSSVKRTLKRNYLIRQRSPWKRWHFSEQRPLVLKPGDLVQVDTIHIVPGNLYVYTLLDVFSRWAYARVSQRINTHRSLLFVRFAQRIFPVPFSMLQSDHGSEFSTYFSENIRINHRHSRVRKPNDNGHLERFNRSLKEECLKEIPRSFRAYQKTIPEYLDYYNNERLHLGLNLKTPSQVVTSY